MKPRSTPKLTPLRTASPPRKRPKPEKLLPLVGGMTGPEKSTQLLDTGGSGECGWRAAGLVLA